MQAVGPPSADGYRFGAFHVDLRAREVRKHGRKVKLQDQPFRVLALLLDSFPHPVTREDLQKRLWGENTFVEFDHGLSNAISRIREALGDSAEESRFIETLPKVGYRFIADLERTDEAAANRADKAISGGVLDDRQTVAVVPLQLHGGSPEDRFLSIALADAIANRLGSASALVVRPTTSVLKYASKKVDWSQIARELNVDIVVEGSIQKQGSAIRTLVQAWQVDGARSIHSVKVDGEMCRLFDHQDRLAESIFEALVPRVSEKRKKVTPPATRHPMAFELYMRAVERSVYFDKYELGSAIEMLTRAVDLDPAFADAWGLLATVCYHMGAHVDPNPKWFDQSEKAALRALELDPASSDAFCMRGMILWSPSRGFQFKPALRALNIALKLNPSRHFARAHRSAVLFHMGFHEAAQLDYKESVLANPDFALPYCGRSYIAVYMGDYGLAEELVDRALAIEPGLVHANIHAPLPSIYAGNLAKAREKLRKARQMTPEEPQLTSLEGLILAREGDFKRAEQLADQAVANPRSMVHTHHCWHCAAGVYAMCGKPEKAVAELRRCAETGLPNHRAFENDPFLNELRSHPEFLALISDLRRGYRAFRDEFDLNDGLMSLASALGEPNA